MKKRLLMTAVGVLVSLTIYVVLDLTAAQFCKSYCGQIWDRGHRQKFRIKHDVRHHALHPNVTVIDDWGGRSYPLFTNSLGFRDAEPREVAKKSDGYRILVLGDSFTEGSGVTWEESFAGRLQQAFAARNVEILNGAVSSYAPAVYYALANELIVDKGYAVDRVYLFLDQSDVENSADWYRVTADKRAVDSGDEHGQRRVFGDGGDSWLKENSITVAFAYLFRDFLSYRWKRRSVSGDYVKTGDFIDRDLWRDRVANVSATAWCDTSVEAPAWSGRGTDFASRYMTELASLLSARSIPLTVFVYPWPSNILRPAETTRCTDYWVDWGKAQSVPVVDLAPAFAGESDPWKTLTRYYIPYDVHWGPGGHAAVAREVGKLLEKDMAAK